MLADEINFNTFRKESENLRTYTNNFMTIIEGDNEIPQLNLIIKRRPTFNYVKKINKSELLSRLNEDIQPNKKSKIVAMKIIRKQKETE